MLRLFTCIDMFGCRLSGLSPFMGETDVETMANVTVAKFDFDDEAFEKISADAKDFISKLLLKDKEYVNVLLFCLSVFTLLTCLCETQTG